MAMAFFNVSSGPSQLLPWPVPQPGDTRAQLLAAAVDETVTDFVLFDVAGMKTLAFDNSLNLWTTGDTSTGSAYQEFTRAGSLKFPHLVDEACGGFGFSAGAISRQKRSVGTRSDTVKDVLLRVDLTTGTQTCYRRYPLLTRSESLPILRVTILVLE